MVTNFRWNNQIFPFTWPSNLRSAPFARVLPLIKLPSGVADMVVGVKVGQRLCGLATVVPIIADQQLELITTNQPLGQRMVQAAGCYLTMQLLFERILPPASQVRLLNSKLTVDNFVVDVLVNPPLKITIKHQLEALVAEHKNTVHYASDSVRQIVDGSAPSIPAAPFRHIQFFRLLSVSGVIYREHNAPVSRLRATALATVEQIKNFQAKVSLTEQYDHRVLGRQMELFLFSPVTGQGLVLWRPRGVAMLTAIRDYVAEHNRKWHYQSVMTPVLGSKTMYEQSGHLAHYQSDMFGEIRTHSESLFLRPMTCPHHIMMYKLTGVHSYRELPLKLAEFAQLFRYEASGALAGIERTRAMTLPDAHLFLTLAQLEVEIKKCFCEIKQALADFQLPINRVVLARHDHQQTDKYYPAVAMWRSAEATLVRVLTDLKVPFENCIGEAAFYGPKIDFQVLNLAQHEITLASLQLDFMLPERFKLQFVGTDQMPHQPIMIHRGLIGSVERLIAVMLEQTKGWLPLWLAPVQVMVVPMKNEQHRAFSEQLARQLAQAQIRYQVQHSPQRIGVTVRQVRALRIPYLVLIGDKEIAANQLSVRTWPDGTISEMKVEVFIEQIKIRLKKKL